MDNLQELIDNKKLKIKVNKEVIKGNTKYRLVHYVIKITSITKNIILLAIPYCLSAGFGYVLSNAKVFREDPNIVKIVFICTTIIFGKFISYCENNKNIKYELIKELKTDFKIRVKEYKKLNELYEEDLELLGENYGKHI